MDLLVLLKVIGDQIIENGERQRVIRQLSKAIIYGANRTITKVYALLIDFPRIVPTMK